ncbi:MAG: acyloxyacyl hydrolase [Chthoniobacterales bacterium]
MNVKRAICSLLIGACALASAHAGEEVVRSRAVTSDFDSRFNAGTWSLEDLVGTFFLFDRAGNTRPVMDIAINTVRLGYMVNNPALSGPLRGNVELLGEIFGGTIFNGPGDVIAGGTAFLRYNFVQPNARLVPYLQGGGGFVYSDFAHGLVGGNAVSLDVNFNLQAIGGLRFNVTRQWSVLTEISYRHISNASTSDPNYGIDQLGGAAGVSFSF